MVFDRAAERSCPSPALSRCFVARGVLRASWRARCRVQERRRAAPLRKAAGVDLPGCEHLGAEVALSLRQSHLVAGARLDGAFPGACAARSVGGSISHFADPGVRDDPIHGCQRQRQPVRVGRFVELTAAFAVPIGHARLEACDRLNRELEQLFLARETPEYRNPAPSHNPQAEMFESRFDLFTWPEPCIQELRNFMLDAVFRVAMAASETAPEEFARLRLNNHTWFHITRHTGHFVAHNHALASWSAVYCVKDGTDAAGAPRGGLLRLFDTRGGADAFRGSGQSALATALYRGRSGPAVAARAAGRVPVLPVPRSDAVLRLGYPDHRGEQLLVYRLNCGQAELLSSSRTSTSGCSHKKLAGRSVVTVASRNLAMARSFPCPVTSSRILRDASMSPMPSVNPNAGLASLATKHRMPKRFRGQLRDVAIGLHAGCRLVQSHVAVTPKAKNAHIDRALALELRADPGAFPHRILRLRIEGQVALRCDREGPDEPVLEIMFAAHRIARRHPEPLVQLDDSEAPEEVRVLPALSNQRFIQARG